MDGVEDDMLILF